MGSMFMFVSYHEVFLCRILTESERLIVSVVFGFGFSPLRMAVQHTRQD